MNVGDADMARGAIHLADQAEQVGRRGIEPRLADRISVVVPTRNEEGCIGELLARLAATGAAARTVFEVIIVDDSDDATAACARAAAADAEVRRHVTVDIIRREPRQRTHGLSGAVVLGLAVATGRWVVVMDGDLQHPPEVIVDLLRAGRDHRASLVVASR